MTQDPAQKLPVVDQAPTGVPGLEIDPYAHIKVNDSYDASHPIGDQCTEFAGDGLRCLRGVHPDHWNHLSFYRSRVIAVRSSGSTS